jgi:hypothetical protein
MSEWAWAAGLFEGEGSIQVPGKRSNRPGNRLPWLSMGTTDKDVLDRFTAVVGGKVRGPYRGQGKNTPEHYKPIWHWQLTGIERVQATLREFWPYLGERRRARAGEAIAAYYFTDRVPQRRNTLAYE